MQTTLRQLDVLHRGWVGGGFSAGVLSSIVTIITLHAEIGAFTANLVGACAVYSDVVTQAVTSHVSAGVPLGSRGVCVTEVWGWGEVTSCQWAMQASIIVPVLRGLPAVACTVMHLRLIVPTPIRVTVGRSPIRWGPIPTTYAGWPNTTMHAAIVVVLAKVWGLSAVWGGVWVGVCLHRVLSPAV